MWLRGNGHIRGEAAPELRPRFPHFHSATATAVSLHPPKPIGVRMARDSSSRARVEVEPEIRPSFSLPRLATAAASKLMEMLNEGRAWA